jgi:predicted Zn-dependent peptidase
LLSLTAPGLAQVAPPSGQTSQDKQSVSVSKVERKNLAPVSKEILRVKLPRPVDAMLDNGLTVLVLEDRRLPNISVNLTIEGAGGLYDPADLPGLANITAQMTREGSRTRTSRQIAEETERLAAFIVVNSGFGSSTSSTLFASGLSDNFDQWFALAADILLNPSFPADELAKLKDRSKVQLRQSRASPFFLASERFNRVVYGNHPAAVISATDASLDAITPEMLAKFHRERYAPQNAILAIAGDVSASTLIPKLKTIFQNWQRTTVTDRLPQNPVPAAQRKIYLVHRPNSVQTNLFIGNIAIERKSPDYVAMTVMNRILGGGPASRLFINLREEKGYTYGVGSGLTALKFPGPWSASSSMRTEVTEGALTELLKEVRRMREEKVSDRELDDARRAIVAEFALSLESPAQVIGYEITRRIYGLPADYWDTYPASVSAVSADEVQRVARKYLDPETMQIVAVGEGNKIKTTLEQWGTVEVYDTEGNRVSSIPTDTPVSRR